jgi:hypothetical protein
MTDTPSAPGASETDLSFARLHLRMGLLALARAELEALAARDLLNDEAMVDLAEARWRTGDLAAAGEAARAHLDSGGRELVAYVVAAEAVAAAGRPAEARRLVGRALEMTEQPLDSVFAGMPRSVIWPTDRGTEAEHAGTLFDVHPPGSAARAPTVAWPPGPTSAPDPSRGRAQPQGQGLWGGRTAAPGASTLRDAQEQLEAAGAALEGGDNDSAAVRLAIVLRAAPALAPAVLAAIDEAGRVGHAALELVRGDAYRLVGHEAQARRAFAAAAAALGGGARPTAGAAPHAGEAPRTTSTGQEEA